MNPSPWLNAAEAAAYLKRGRRFILREIAANRIKAARIGGRGEILTRADWLDAYVSDQAAPVMLARRRA